MTNQRRQEIEMQIARRLVRLLLDTGHSVSVWDGEAYACKKETKMSHIIYALRTTDMDVLRVWKDGKLQGCISLIYGNDGWDVIADNSCSLEPLLEPITAYAETLAA